MGEYSNYRLGKVDLVTEKAFLAIIDNFTDQAIWVPKSVVGPDRRIKQWFIDQKNRELKDFMRKNKHREVFGILVSKKVCNNRTNQYM